jgi:hypothetical protein
MKWFALGSVTLLMGCVNSLPVDNPSAPGSFRPGAEQRSEARALEKAEADCASQGKHAQAKRVDGATVYECVSPE